MWLKLAKRNANTTKICPLGQQYVTFHRNFANVCPAPSKMWVLQINVRRKAWIEADDSERWAWPVSLTDRIDSAHLTFQIPQSYKIRPRVASTSFDDWSWWELERQKHWSKKLWVLSLNRKGKRWQSARKWNSARPSNLTTRTIVASSINRSCEMRSRRLWRSRNPRTKTSMKLPMCVYILILLFIWYNLIVHLI